MASTATLVVRFVTDASSAVRGVETFAGKVDSFAKSAVKSGAVAAAALAGAALWKGFTRLTDIENAEAKLRGLGYSARQVSRIMASANAAVVGTAFGLGEAASAAANAVAAGVKPGKELQRTLTLVGDAATIAGVDFADMAGLFNEVAAGGKVNGEIINRLADRGIPILQLLGDQLGVSASQVSDLVSEGKVGFKQFQNAIEAGMGGAAQEAGKTTTGALKNVSAALGRLGAAFLGTGFSRIPDALAQVITVLDRLTPAAAAAGRGIGRAFSWIGDVVAQVWPIVQKVARVIGGVVVDALRGLEPVVQGVVKAFRDWMPVLRVVVPVVLGIAAAFGYWGTAMLALATLIATKLVSKIGPPILKVVAFIGRQLAPAFDTLVDVWKKDVLPALKVVGDAFRRLWPHIQPLVKVLGAVVLVFALIGPAILAVAAIIVGKLLPPIIRLVGWVVGKMVPGFRAGVQVLTIVGRAIGTVFSAIGSAIGRAGSAIGDFFGPLPGRAKKTASRVVSAFAGLGKKIWKKAGNVTSAFARWVSALPGKAKDSATRVLRSFANLATRIWRSAGNIASTFGRWVSRLPGRAKDTASRILRAFSGLASKIWRGAGNLASSFGSWASGIAGKAAGIASDIVGAFRGLGSKILSAIGTINIGSLIKMPPKGGGVPYVPGLAEGGIVRSPTLAVVGDNPSPKGEAVIPLDKIDRYLGGGGPITVEVHLDGQVIGRYVEKKVDASMARQARRIITGAA